MRPALATAGAASLSVAASLLAYGVRGKLTFRDRLLGMIDWHGNETVLDIGTGRGLLMLGAAKRLTTGNAIGIDRWNRHDLTANTMLSALRNAEIEGVRAKVSVQREDARSLPFSDESFDIVLSTLCLHHVAPASAREAACREIARVLKAGGTALIADSTRTAEYVRTLGAAGLIVERSQPYVRESLTSIRVVAATKPPRARADLP